MVKPIQTWLGKVEQKGNISNFLKVAESTSSQDGVKKQDMPFWYIIGKLLIYKLLRGVKSSMVNSDPKYIIHRKPSKRTTFLVNFLLCWKEKSYFQLFRDIWWTKDIYLLSIVSVSVNQNFSYLNAFATSSEGILHALTTIT